MNRQALARATEGTSAPTPGYLYRDLAQAASSNPNASQEMANYLINRLEKTNPNIKFKSLKVISKLCDQVPRNQFRRCISQNPHGVGLIKQACSFRGAPDPVTGDEANLKVRQAAQEALDAVYRETPSSEAVPAPSYGQYGNVSAAGGGGGAASSANRFQGIGNPRFNDPRADSRYNGNNTNTSIKDVVRDVGGVVVGMIKDPLARNAEVGPANRGHSGNLPGYSGGGNVRIIFIPRQFLFANKYLTRFIVVWSSSWRR
jgi:hypothetical protein